MTHTQELETLLRNAQTALIPVDKHATITADHIQEIISIGNISAEWDDEKEQWIIKVWETVHNYPHSHDDLEDVTVSATNHTTSAAHIMMDLAFTQIAEVYWETVQIEKESATAETESFNEFNS